MPEQTTNKKKVSPLKFLREVKAELKKVIWPTPKQLVNNTIIVLVCIAIIGAFIALLDYGFNGTIKFFFENKV